MTAMIIWVYVGTILIGSQPLTVAGDMKYAFVDRAQCEQMIKGSTVLKCIPLELK